MCLHKLHYVYIYIHTYIHTHTHIYICIYTHTQGLAEVTPLSVAGWLRECLAQDGQQFEHFT